MSYAFPGSLDNKDSWILGSHCFGIAVLESPHLCISRLMLIPVYLAEALDHYLKPTSLLKFNCFPSFVP